MHRIFGSLFAELDSTNVIARVSAVPYRRSGARPGQWYTISPLQRALLRQRLTSTRACTTGVMILCRLLVWRHHASYFRVWALAIATAIINLSKCRRTACQYLQHTSAKCVALSQRNAIRRMSSPRKPSVKSSRVIRREGEMWRWLLALASMPGAMVLVAYRIIPESPRHLSIVGRHDEAVKVRVGRSRC